MNLQRALNPRLIEGQLIIIVWLLRYLWHFKYRKGKHNTQFKLRIKVRHRGGGEKAQILGSSICGETLLNIILRPDYENTNITNLTNITRSKW